MTRGRVQPLAPSGGDSDTAPELEAHLCLQDRDDTTPRCRAAANQFLPRKVMSFPNPLPTGMANTCDLDTANKRLRAECFYTLAAVDSTSAVVDSLSPDIAAFLPAAGAVFDRRLTIDGRCAPRREPSGRAWSSERETWMRALGARTRCQPNPLATPSRAPRAGAASHPCPRTPSPPARALLPPSSLDPRAAAARPCSRRCRSTETWRRRKRRQACRFAGGAASWWRRACAGGCALSVAVLARCASRRRGEHAERRLREEEEEQEAAGTGERERKRAERGGSLEVEAACTLGAQLARVHIQVE
eukprot:3213710-Rhodomonas_salina.1